jgi:hypothetical protein
MQAILECAAGRPHVGLLYRRAFGQDVDHLFLRQGEIVLVDPTSRAIVERGHPALLWALDLLRGDGAAAAYPDGFDPGSGQAERWHGLDRYRRWYLHAAAEGTKPLPRLCDAPGLL